MDTFVNKSKQLYSVEMLVLLSCRIFHIFKTHLSCKFFFVTGAYDEQLVWGFKMKYKNV